MVLNLHERERDYRYAAEAALQQMKSRVNRDATWRGTIPDNGYLQLNTGSTLTDAQGQPVPRVLVNTYVGYTGDTVGRFGPFLRCSRSDDPVHKTSRARSAGELLTYAISRIVAGGSNTVTASSFGSRTLECDWVSWESPGPTYFDTSGFGRYRHRQLLGSNTAARPRFRSNRRQTRALAAMHGWQLNFDPSAAALRERLPATERTYRTTRTGRARNAPRLHPVDVGAAERSAPKRQVRVSTSHMDRTARRGSIAGNIVSSDRRARSILQNQAVRCSPSQPEEFFTVASLRRRDAQCIQLSTFRTITNRRQQRDRAPVRSHQQSSPFHARCFPGFTVHVRPSDSLTSSTAVELHASRTRAPTVGSGTTSAAAVVLWRAGHDVHAKSAHCAVEVANAAAVPGATRVALGTWRQAPGGIQLAGVAANVGRSRAPVSVPDHETVQPQPKVSSTYRRAVVHERHVRGIDALCPRDGIHRRPGTIRIRARPRRNFLGSSRATTS